MSLLRKLNRKKLKHKNNKEPDYIESWKEWQEHQYVSGYYTGGKIPYFFKDLNLKPSSLTFFIGGIALFIITVYKSLILDKYSSMGPFGYASTILAAGFAFLLIYVGVCQLKKAKKENERKKRKFGH